MKVVIDTNVLVSAILKDRKPEKIILFIVEHPDFEWVASGEIVAEYLDVIRRPKFSLPEVVIAEWTDMLDTVVRLIEVRQSYDFPRDQKDAKFLACCLAANVEFLITGDRDFDDVHKIGQTIILSVSLFESLVINAYRL